jgi:NIPSNAP protein
MTDRRRFLKILPATALTSAAMLSSGSSSAAEQSDSASKAIYEIITLRLESGGQMGRLTTWFEKRAFPVLQKHKVGPVGLFTTQVGPVIPSLVGILPFPSFTEMSATWERISSDPEWLAAENELEAGEPAYYRRDSALLRATAFSPPLAATASGTPAHKIYELRIYESPTSRQLSYLHDRFAGGEIDIFHKSGIHPVLYADTIVGPNMPNMAYLIPFENLQAREAAWAAFGSNPDWQKIRDESIKHGGEIVRNITNMFFSPVAFSMLR